MTVLVTGGAGYIGAQMVHDLVDRGHRPIVLDNLSTGFRASIPPGAHFVQADVGDETLLARLIGDHDVDAIIHFAAKVVVPESVTDPLGYYFNNTVKSRTLIAAAVASRVKRFVFSSTAAVYGQPSVSPVREDAPLNPISPYGWSKLMTEQILRDTAHAHDFSYVALRYFNVAGADPKGRTGQSTANATHLIKVAVQAALGLRPYLEVFGTDYPTPDSSCVRDYIHVADLIDAHTAALAYLEAGGAPLACNCGYGRGYSVLEVIAAVKAVSGVDFEVRLSPRRLGDPASVVAAPNLARERLQWRATRDDLPTIIAHALAWERKLQASNCGTA